MPVLDVAPAELREAAGLVGDTAATLVRLAWVDLQEVLADCAGMAGTDPAGVAWGDAYDTTAANIAQAATDLLNGCSHVGALLDQSGINYAHAEASSARMAATTTPPRFGGDWCSGLGAVPEASEGGIAPPGGWSMLARYIERAWPDGHQDRLHHAAGLWHRAASQVRSARPEVDQAKAQVLDQRITESQPAATVLDELVSSLHDLADGCDAIGQACTDYAHHLDSAHHLVIRELEEFLAWSAGIQVAGGIFAAVSFGASEAIAQASEEGTAIKFGKTIATIIDGLVTAARAVAAALTAIGPRIAAVIDRIRPILARRLAEVRLAMESDLGEIRIGRKLPSQITPAADTTAEGKAIEELEEVAGLTDAEIDSIIDSASTSTIQVADRQAARQYFTGPLRTPANTFFREATGKSRDFTIETLPDGRYRLSFFSPADNAGYGKRYLYVMDSDGTRVAEFKDTIGPEGPLNRKFLHRGPK